MNKLEIYQFDHCPFCMKVQRAMATTTLPLKYVDILQDTQLKEELIEFGGKLQVPCLKVSGDEHTLWLYESDDIIAYLNNLEEA
jgi:glutaredoxin 2